MSGGKKEIHHFPGHMKRALDRLAPFIRLCDFFVEISDARAPESSRNPLFRELIHQKPFLLLLSKSDRADEKITAKWLSFYRKMGISSFAGDLTKGKFLSLFAKESAPLLQKKREKEDRFHMKHQEARVLVFGVPNVGKSTFINSLAGKNRVKSENRPGVTRAEQWIHLPGNITLLDTPGILPMRYEDKEEAKRLALLGSLPDVILPTHDLYISLFSFLKEKYPQSLLVRYDIEDLSVLSSEELLQKVAEKRGYLGKGGKIQSEEVEKLILREFREGVLGRFSLEEPPDVEL